MKIDPKDTYLLAVLSECPKIKAVYTKDTATSKLMSQWITAVAEAWGIPRFSAWRTTTTNGPSEKVRVTGCVPHYPTHAEAVSAAKILGIPSDKVKPDDGDPKFYWFRAKMNSSHQKEAARLASELGIVGSDSSRSIFNHLRNELGGVTGWEAFAWTPGLVADKRRAMFITSSNMKDWPKVLKAAGAKEISFAEAAAFLAKHTKHAA